MCARRAPRTAARGERQADTQRPADGWRGRAGSSFIQQCQSGVAPWVALLLGGVITLTFFSVHQPLACHDSKSYTHEAHSSLRLARLTCHMMIHRIVKVLRYRAEGYVSSAFLYGTQFSSSGSCFLLHCGYSGGITRAIGATSSVNAPSRQRHIFCAARPARNAPRAVDGSTRWLVFWWYHALKDLRSRLAWPSTKRQFHALARYAFQRTLVSSWVSRLKLLFHAARIVSNPLERFTIKVERTAHVLV